MNAGTVDKPKRTKKEVFFIILGALVLVGTFVFKEVLVDPLKDEIAEASSDIAQYKETLTTEHIDPDGATDDLILQPDLDDPFLRKINDILQKLSQQSLEATRLRGKIPADVVGKDLVRELEEHTDQANAALGVPVMHLAAKAFASKVGLTDDEKAQLPGQILQAEIPVGLVRITVNRMEEAIESKKGRVRIYTRCAWIMFGVGVVLAVIGRIFHVPGLDSAGGAG